MINSKKASNSALQVKGKVKEITGRATGDTALRVEGEDDQTLARLRQAGQKLKDAFKK